AVQLRVQSVDRKRRDLLAVEKLLLHVVVQGAVGVVETLPHSPPLLTKLWRSLSARLSDHPQAPKARRHAAGEIPLCCQHRFTSNDCCSLNHVVVACRPASENLTAVESCSTSWKKLKNRHLHEAVSSGGASDRRKP